MHHKTINVERTSVQKISLRPFRVESPPPPPPPVERPAWSADVRLPGLVYGSTDGGEQQVPLLELVLHCCDWEFAVCQHFLFYF